MSRPVTRIARWIVLDNPVLIAAHGDSYHRAPVLYTDARTPPGVPPITVAADTPNCGAQSERWLAVDREFAELLERGACERCWPEAWEQLTVNDPEGDNG